MARFVLRPTYYEGQLLAATDLGELVDYVRARGERHDRSLHRPGIVTGLALEADDATDATGNPYKRVFVTPGLAIDGLGREILISERTELNAQRFRQTLGASADATSFFPVFVRSVFAGQEPGAVGLALCQSTRSKRIEEGVDIFVGRAGDETAIEATVAQPGAQASAAEGAGPALLLGFVQWNPAVGQFAEIALSANGSSRRYAGVNASTVAGIGNRVLLQLKPTAASGDLAFELDGTAGAMRFGPLQASGTIGDPLLSVDNKGNLTAKGVLSGRSTTGAVLMHTGTASDGLILPLPPGVSDAQVTSGAVNVHALVSPHVDPADAPDTTNYWSAQIEECRVDDARRLHCRIAWWRPGNAAPQLVSSPGAADYLVIATTKAEGAT